MGILAAIAGLVMLILVHEFGHWAVAQWRGMRCPVFSIGFGKPYMVLGYWRGTEFRLTPWLLGGYVSLPDMHDETTVEDKTADDSMAEGATSDGEAPADVATTDDSFPQAQPVKEFKIFERAAVAAAGVTMNFIVALVLTFLLFAAIGLREYQPRDVFVAELSISNTIARDAGIRPGDIVVSVDGKPVNTLDDFTQQLSCHKGTAAILVVKRGDQLCKIEVTPNQGAKIGIVIAAHVKCLYKKVNIWQATVATFKFNVEMGWQMVRGLGMMLHIVPVPKNVPAGATDVHGIVAIVQFCNMAYQDSWYSFVMMVIMISMNLAFCNLLPIPVLDGGYLLFYAIEAVRGKPIEDRLQQKILIVFFIMLIYLMILGLFNDIFRPINFGK